MRVIFLDVDGVLNSSKCFKLPHERDPLDEDCLDCLKEIVDATDAKIVVTSTWRMMEDTKFKLGRKLFEHGMRILSDTPVLRDGRRDDEIQQWLDKSLYNIDSFVVLDDDAMESEILKSRQVRTSWNEGGLNSQHVKEAIKILNTSL